MELLELVKRSQHGDDQAFTDICKRFTGLVKKYAFQAHIRPIAEEAEAECWLAIAKAVKNYDENSGIRFAGYVDSMVRFAVWNLFKHERRRWQTELQLENQEDEGISIIDMLSETTDIEREFELKCISKELKLAMQSLPIKQRQVIQYTIVEDERLTELAAKMGVTVQAVHNLRKRGLSRLKVLCAGMYTDERR